MVDCPKSIYCLVEEFDSRRKTNKNKPSIHKMPARTVKKSAKKRDHPSYEEMVAEAITHYNKRSGTSLQALKTYLLENFDLPENFSTTLRTQLKRLLEKGMLQKVKASYKLTKEAKKGITLVPKKQEESSEEEHDEEEEKKKTTPRKTRATTSGITKRRTRSAGKKAAKGAVSKKDDKEKVVQDKARDIRTRRRARAKKD